jgi:hypothetical protein
LCPAAVFELDPAANGDDRQYLWMSRQTGAATLLV